jgi:signal transduction histidine kinase
MNWYTVNYALGSIVSFLLGIFVLYRGETRSLTRKTWFLLCVFVSVWHAGKFLIVITQSEFLAEKAAYLVYVGAILIPPCYLHFILSLLDEERKHRGLLVVSYLFCLVEFLLLIGGGLIEGVKYYPGLGFYEVPAKTYWLYVASYVIVPSIALLKLILVFSRTDIAAKRNQFKYVIYSSLIGFLAGATSFVPFVTSVAPPFGAPVVYFYTLPITYAVARYRLLDINVVIRKSVTYALLLSLLLIPCYLLVVWGQQLVFGNINLFFSIFTLGLFLIVGFLFPRLRFQTEEALERVLFKKRYDYRETLSRSSKDMVSMVDLDALSNNLVHTIGRALGIEKASLFLVDDVKGFFELKATIGLDLDEFKELVLSRDDFLVQRLTRNPEPIVREEMEMTRNGSESGAIVERMRQLVAAISLPIVSKDRLIGILNLGHKDGREMYSDEDLELLSTLANQAAIAIDNARLYENLKQSQNIIRRADRLSSLGQLTAGLAHEIRNPLVAIRTFTQLLPERYQDVDFRNSFQSLALKEVDRICGLVNDLLSFARPSAPNVAAENVNEIVDSIVRILETEAKEKGVQIYRRLATNLPKVLIDKEQIKQVSMNIILNALQSIQGKGVVEVSTRIFAKDSASEFVQVSVHDSGVGIPEKDLENIFNPFFTTKKEGVGLGLSITHQIVQEHGGYIVVESQVGRGTTFFINLPVKRSNLQETRTHPQINEENPGR